MSCQDATAAHMPAMPLSKTTTKASTETKRPPIRLRVCVDVCKRVCASTATCHPSCVLAHQLPRQAHTSKQTGTRVHKAAWRPKPSRSCCVHQQCVRLQSSTRQRPKQRQNKRQSRRMRTELLKGVGVIGEVCLVLKVVADGLEVDNRQQAHTALHSCVCRPACNQSYGRHQEDLRNTWHAVSSIERESGAREYGREVRVRRHLREVRARRRGKMRS